MKSKPHQEPFLEKELMDVLDLHIDMMKDSYSTYMTRKGRCVYKLTDLKIIREVACLKECRRLVRKAFR